MRSISPRLVVVLPLLGIAAAALYTAYGLIDPLPPRQFAIGAGIPGSPYDGFARQYARILARDGVTLQVRSTASSVESLANLRDQTSGVQAALTTFGFTSPSDLDALYSLGGVFDAPIFLFYRGAEPITNFAQLKGMRLSIGTPGSALRSLMSEVLRSAGVADNSVVLSDLDYGDAIEAVSAGEIDVVAFTSELDGALLQRALNADRMRMMNIGQAAAVSRKIAGLKHVVLSRGLISLGDDIPATDFDLLAFRSRVLVRKDLHPALQYLLLEAMREVHSKAGPFNRLGEFPAEQPNDLPLSPTAEAFYRSGSTFWQRYTSFWITSLLKRTLFFVIPIVVLLIPVVGFAPTLYRWFYARRLDRLHYALGKLESELARADRSQPTKILEIAWRNRICSAVGEGCATVRS